MLSITTLIAVIVTAQTKEITILAVNDMHAAIDGLRTLLNHFDFRHVYANMYAPDSLRLHIEPYKIFEIDGIRIAALGLIHRSENSFLNAYIQTNG